MDTLFDLLFQCFVGMVQMGGALGNLGFQQIAVAHQFRLHRLPLGNVAFDGSHHAIEDMHKVVDFVTPDVFQLFVRDFLGHGLGRFLQPPDGPYQPQRKKYPQHGDDD